jgi:hypothetical protein
MKKMKNRKIVNLAIVFLLTVTTIACSNDDSDNNNDSNNTNTEIQQTSNLMTSSDWVITNFVDSGEDETNNFNGYSFSFNSDGTLVASNGSNMVSGTWSITDDGSSDDSNDDIDFNIFFAAPDEFNDLSDDWDIVSKNDTTIVLIDISGGNGGTDHLTFEKN